MIILIVALAQAYSPILGIEAGQAREELVYFDISLHQRDVIKQR